MADATYEELLDISLRLAKELTEFVEAGEESGSDMAGPRALLNDFKKLWRRTHRYWQYAITKLPDKEATLLDEL